jgi:hypothetical protein
MDAVMRISRFRPRPNWGSVDPALREALSLFLAQSSLVDAWLGRRITADGEDRAFVSVWRSAADESEGLRIPEMLPASLGIEPPARVVLPVALDLRFQRTVAPAILRIYEGTTLPGQLDLYVEEARRGSLVDGDRPEGPHAICMALDPPDKFITASLWTDWASIATCTGGDTHRPLTTRNRDRLAGGGPTHYELITTG